MSVQLFQSSHQLIIMLPHHIGACDPVTKSYQSRDNEHDIEQAPEHFAEESFRLRIVP